MIITISGTPGSGKSTIGKALASELGYEHYSTGDFMRDLAVRKGMTLRELCRIAERDRSVDRAIDDYSSNLGRTSDDFVIDSRLAFHFIPGSLKIYVKCSVEEGARRIFRDIVSKRRPYEDDIASMEDAIIKVKERMASERRRYRKYYGIDVDDESNYDIIIDTTGMDKESAIGAAIGAVKKHLKKE